MGENGRITEEERRRKRLADQLRQNMLRRKAQARARRSGDADQRSDGLGQPGGVPVEQPEDS